jgi:carbamoylphosphate synthase large subunit
MEICYDQAQFERYVAEAFAVAQGQPVLIDRFLEDAIECDVDCICDGEQVIIAGVMEHIEEAGVHSGDSACAIPPHSLSPELVAEIKKAASAMAKSLGVVGLMNVQFAVKKEDGEPQIYVIEANPASEPDSALCGQGHGAARCQGCRQSDGGAHAGRAGRHGRSSARTCKCQRERLPVCEVRRRRHRARA